MRLNSGEVLAKRDPRSDANVHFTDPVSQSGSSLLPMLVAGIVLITVGMIVVMAFS